MVCNLTQLHQSSLASSIINNIDIYEEVTDYTVCKLDPMSFILAKQIYKFAHLLQNPLNVEFVPIAATHSIIQIDLK